jgi:hypothetical protein
MFNLNEGGKRAHAQSFDLSAQYGDLLRLGFGQFDESPPFDDLLVRQHPIAFGTCITLNRDETNNIVCKKFLDTLITPHSLNINRPWLHNGNASTRHRILATSKSTVRKCEFHYNTNFDEEFSPGH